MKKIVIGLIVILAIAGGCAPFINGILAERVVKQTIEDTNKMYAEAGTDITLEVVNYDRKFSSSDMEWKINLGKFKAFYGIEEVIFVDHVKHGYAGVVSTTSLEKNQWFNDFITNKLAGVNPFHIRSEYKIPGKINSKVTVDAFEIEVDADVLQIKPASMTITTDGGLEEFISEASWEGLVVPEKFSVSGAVLKSNLKKESTFIWTGDITYALESINVLEQEGIFGLTNLKGEYKLDSDETNQKLSFLSDLGIESLTVAQQKIDNAFVSFGVNGVDTPGYEEFFKLYTESMNAVLKEVSQLEEDPEQVQAVMEEQMAMIGFQMMAAYEKLLKEGLEIKISNLHVETQMGEINGDISLRLKKDMTIAEFMPVMGQPDLALGILSVKSDVSLPKILVGENPMLLTPAFPGMQTGLFMENGEILEHKAETRDGKLYLNDLEVDLNMN